MHYSKATGGFYDVSIHGKNIPDDAVEISTEQHAALIQGQAEGKRIIAGEDGYPILADYPAPTDEELSASIRLDRNAKLAACDWTVLSDAPLTTTQKTNWKTYRQSLRDITDQPGFPSSVEWPVVPA